MLEFLLLPMHMHQAIKLIMHDAIGQHNGHADITTQANIRR